MVLFAISDQLAQILEIQRQRNKSGGQEASSTSSKKAILLLTNKKRSVFSGLVGLLYFGPMAHLWYVRKPPLCCSTSVASR
jgi:hypothetical protein